MALLPEEDVARLVTVLRGWVLLASTEATEDDLLALERAAAAAWMKLVGKRCPEVRRFARLADGYKWNPGDIVQVLGEEGEGRKVRVQWVPQDDGLCIANEETWNAKEDTLAPLL